MYQSFWAFFLIGCIGLALAGAWWLFLMCRGDRRIFKEPRLLIGSLALIALCVFFILKIEPRMSRSIYYHMSGLILWCAATLILYKCYCDFSDIDANPIAYIRLMILPVMVGWCFLFWPWVQHNGSLSQQNWLQVLFQSVHYAWRTFTLENSFEEFWGGINTFTALTAWDRTYISALVVIAPILTLTVALSFFTVPVFMMKLLFLRGRRVYIFSDLNDRAIRYAKAMQNADGSRARLFKKPLIAFCADKEKEEESTASLSALNAVTLRRGIDHLHFIWIARKRRIRFYLISNDDNLNTQQAEQLRKKYRNKCYIRCVTAERINEVKIDELNAAIRKDRREDLTDRLIRRLKARSAAQAGEGKAGRLPALWNGLLERCEQVTFDIDKDDRKTIFGYEAQKVRSSGIELVAEARRALFTEFYEHPLLTAPLLNSIRPVNGSKTVRILILGGGTIGAELARLCLWYCQLPDVTAEVTVADAVSDQVLRARILRNCISIQAGRAADAVTPETYKDTFEVSQIRILGYQAAKLNTWGNTDFVTDDVLDRVDREAAPFHTVFVCTGNDDMNYQLSIRLRRYYLRKNESWGCPNIRAIIWNDTMANLVNPDKHSALSGVGCGGMFYRGYGDQPADRYNAECRIDIFGSMLDSIWKCERLMFMGLCYHAYYSGDLVGTEYPITMKRETVRDYFLGPERNRRSSMALALHGRCKEEWKRYRGESAAEEELAQAEHIRWCIYELLEGHVMVPAGAEDKYFNSRYQKKNRDTDEVRGYHAVLRSWESLEQMAEKNRTAQAEQGDIDWGAWEKAYLNNISTIRFSASLEKRFAPETPDEQTKKCRTGSLEG